MTDRKSQFAVRRILLALDTTAGNLPSFESAVELASQLEAELAALFIEDPNLLRLAGLSFVREIRFPSATEEEPEPARIERELRVLAEQARQALAAAAERAKLRWSFRVVRGAIATELRAAVAEADLLLLGARARPKPQTLAVCLGLTDDSRVLAAASRVAEARGDGLIVLLPPQPAESLMDEIRRLVGAATRFFKLPGTDASSIALTVRQTGGGVVVISGASLLGGPAEIRLLASIGSPVALVC
jgi:hypothetical protein